MDVAIFSQADSMISSASSGESAEIKNFTVIPKRWFTIVLLRRIRGQKVCHLLWLNTISSRVLSPFCLTPNETGTGRLGRPTPRKRVRRLLMETLAMVLEVWAADPARRENNAESGAGGEVELATRRLETWSQRPLTGRRRDRSIIYAAACGRADSVDGRPRRGRRRRGDPCHTRQSPPASR